MATLKEDGLVVAGVAIAIIAVLWYAKNQAVAAGNAVADLASNAADAVVSGAQAVGTAINPVSDQNIINRGVNAAVQGITGDPNQTLGGWIYDVTH